MANFLETAPTLSPHQQPLPERSADPNASITDTRLEDANDLLSLFELSWHKLVLHGPALASLFAFAYVVGYFYAYDITWFPFFILAEHLVFALRAIPIAIVAFVGLIIGVNYSTKCNTQDYKWNNKLRILLVWLKYLWLNSLGLASCGLIMGNCVGPGLSLVGIWYFSLLEKPHRPLIHFMYWGINLFVLCLMLGFVSGSTWRIYRSPWATLQHVIWKNSTHVNAAPVGHIIFSGSNGILIFDYCLRQTRLVRLDDIEEIMECRGAKCKIECNPQETNSSYHSSSQDRMIL